MRRILLLCILLAVAHNLCAQGSATFHVFPQIADGLDSGGTSPTGYVSSVLITNTSAASATCTLQLYGAGLANRIAGPSTVTLQGSGSFATINTTLLTFTLLPLATGYGTLNCTQPVAATVAYVYASLSGIIGGATVFSSPAATRAQLLTIASTRLGFAIANNTDAAAQYQVSLVNASGQIVSSGTVAVGARSNVAKFIDEGIFMNFPTDFTGAFVVSGTTPFNLVGLLFSGNVFTSQPAAILAP
jgi:hypothetical protein